MKHTYFRRFNIRTQMLISTLALLLALAAACTLAAYRVARSNIERNYAANCRQNLQIINEIVGMKLDDTVTLVRETLADAQFLSVLAAPNESGSAYYDSAAYRKLSDLFLTMENMNDYVGGGFVFDLNGRFFSRQRVYRGADSYSRYYMPDALSDLPWLETVRAAKGREVYYGYDLLAGKNAGGFSYAKLIRHNATFEPLGYLVMRLRTTLFSSAITQDSEFPSEMYMVYTPDGELIYSSGGADDAEATLARFLSGDDCDYLFESVENKPSGFHILVSVRRSDLIGISRYVRVMLPLVAALALLVVVLLSWQITLQINKPLEKLKSVVTGLKDGEPITETFDNSEIGRVGAALKQSVNNNLELRARLIESGVKEREAELMLLQSQIDPHFLYNTLDSIYCKAILCKQDEIAEMVMALSRLFKASLGQGKRVVTVREEIEQIRQYMALQKLRYAGRFDLIVDVDEDILDLRIIKLLLQPFIENAMYHGLEMKVGSGYIEVRGERLDDEMYFTITDDGVGMEDVSAFYKGFGVNNVIDRIHLAYGDDYGVRVESEPGRRTSVEIRIPVMKEDMI